MKKYFYLALLGLGLLGCVGPRGNNAGIVNSHKIPYPDYIRSLQGHTIVFQSMHRRPPDQEEKKLLFKETWEDIALHVILKEYHKKYHISTNENEVLDSLKQQIPEMYKSLDTFNKDGVFDTDLYFQSLHYDSPIDMSDTRRQYFEYYVPNQKLKPYIIEHEIFDKKNRRAIMEILSSTADFDLLVFDPALIELKLSEQELRNYYQQHIHNYALSPIYALEYFSLPLKLKTEDLRFTKQVADSIYTEISQGKSIERIVEGRKDWLQGLKLEEPGFQKMENLDAELLWMLENLPDDAYSPLIQKDNGYYIYQKLQRSKSMLRYRSLLIPPTVSDNTINQEYNKALGALDLAKSIGIKNAAEELESQYHSSPELFVTDAWHQDSILMKSVADRLLSHNKGEYLDPIYSPATGSWVIIRLKENQVERAKAFKDLKTEIENEILSARRQELAYQKAKNWLLSNPELKIREERDFIHLSFQKTGTEASYAGISLESLYLKARLEQKLGKKSQVQQIGNISLILIPRKSYPIKGIKPDYATALMQFQKTLSPDWFEKWVEKKYAQAKIEIFVQP